MNNIFITAGDSRTIVLTIKNQNYEPVPLVEGEALITFTVKEQPYHPDSEAVIKKTTEDYIKITDSAGGVAQIRILSNDTDPEQNERIDFKTYYYDVQVQIFGDTFTVNKGRFTITQRVTHDYL